MKVLLPGIVFLVCALAVAASLAGCGGRGSGGDLPRVTPSATPTPVPTATPPSSIGPPAPPSF